MADSEQVKRYDCEIVEVVPNNEWNCQMVERPDGPCVMWPDYSSKCVELAEARKALAKYGRHLPDCEMMRPTVGWTVASGAALGETLCFSPAKMTAEYRQENNPIAADWQANVPAD